MRQRGYWGPQEITEYSGECWGVESIIGPELQLAHRQRLYFVTRRGKLYATLAEEPCEAACDTWWEKYLLQAGIDPATGAVLEGSTRALIEQLDAHTLYASKRSPASEEGRFL